MKALRAHGTLRIAALAGGVAGLAGGLAAAGSVSPPSAAPRPAAAPPAPAPPPAGGLLAAICYHRFGVETPKDPYRVSLVRLAGQLRWLRAHGWAGVSLTQVAAALDGDARALPPKAVLLTVDDGYKAGARAVPVFERYGYRAAYFVVPAVLGHGAFLSYGDLRRLEARGFGIGCHTLTHPDLAKVPRGMDPSAYARWVGRELGESKRLLEAALGHPVRALAWPYGAYNPAVADAALRLGYRQLWTVSGGLNDQAALDRSRLRRLILMGHPSLAAFARGMGELPLKPFAGGIPEGSLLFRSQLPLRVRVPRGCRAVLGGVSVALDAGHGFLLGRRTRAGFHYLNIAEEDGGGSRRTSFLFQVAPDAWRPYFEALSAVAAVSATASVPSPGAPSPRPGVPAPPSGGARGPVAVKHPEL